MGRAFAAGAHRRLQDGAQQRRGRWVSRVVVLHVAHSVLAARAVPHHNYALRAQRRAPVGRCQLAGQLERAGGWLACRPGKAAQAWLQFAYCACFLWLCPIWSEVQTCEPL